jgi:hypothetical protein
MEEKCNWRATVQNEPVHDKGSKCGGGQNDTAPESPTTASEKAGFQAGDEGGPGRGNKTGGQNDPVFKSHETANTTALILLNPDRSCDK